MASSPNPQFPTTGILAGTTMVMSLNGFLIDLRQCNRNSSAPQSPTKGTLWLQDDADTTLDLWMYTGVTWALIGTLDTAGVTFTTVANAPSAESILATHINTAGASAILTKLGGLPLAGGTMSGDLRVPHIGIGIAAGTEPLKFSTTLEQKLAFGTNFGIGITSDEMVLDVPTGYKFTFKVNGYSGTTAFTFTATAATFSGSVAATSFSGDGSALTGVVAASYPLSGLSTVAPALGDFLPFVDISNSNANAKATYQTFLDLMPLGRLGLGVNADITSTNLDSLDYSGMYYGATLTNAPNSGSGSFIIINQKIDANNRTQIAISIASRLMYVRSQTGGSWLSWRMSSNLADAAEAGISVTSTDLDNITTSGFFQGTSLTNSPDGTTGQFVIWYIRVNSTNGSMFAIKTTNPSMMYFRSKVSSTWTSWLRGATISADGSGIDVSSTDLNSIVVTGQYRGTTLTNSPDGTTGLFTVQHIFVDSNSSSQYAIKTTDATRWTRTKTGGTWGSWTRIATYDADIESIAGLTFASGEVPYSTGSNTFSKASSTSFGRGAWNLADGSAFRTYIGAVIGTDVLAYDADLQAIGGVTYAAGDVPYATGPGAFTKFSTTSAGRTLAALAITTGADRIVFWDDSAGVFKDLNIGSGLSITGGDTLTVAGAGTGDVVGPTGATDGNIAVFDGVTGKLLKDFSIPSAGLKDLATLLTAGTGGVLAVSAANDAVIRTLAASAGLTWSNATGASGNPSVALDWAGLSALTTGNIAVGDLVALNDVSASGHVKVTVQVFYDAVNVLTNKASPIGADSFLIWDSVASAAKKAPISGIPVATSQLSGTLAAGQFPAMTGDVTSVAGALATTIAADAVGNTKLANMATMTIKGNNTGGTADPADLTASQVRTVLAMGDAYALNKASTSDLLSGTANVMSMDNVESALAYSTLTDAATVTPNLNSARRFTWTIGGHRTLANPSNQRAGQNVLIVITQDGTGGRTLAYGSAWKFPGGAPTLSTAIGAVDVIVGEVQANGTIRAFLHKAFA